MDEKLIEYTLKRIEESNKKDVNLVYTQMCSSQESLQSVDCDLYSFIESSVEKFLKENNLTNDWFIKEFGDIEVFFEVIYLCSK
jgi:hypothetical protein